MPIMIIIDVVPAFLFK